MFFLYSSYVVQSFCVVIFLLKLCLSERILENEAGHLKPFGATNSVLDVERISGFPNPRTFFEKYAIPKRPLIMRDAAKVSRAFHLWTDEYFYSAEGSKSHKVSTETMKKEDRNQQTKEMSFFDFVLKYNDSDIYMVNPVPEFIRDDVTVPCSLQCEDVIDGKIVESVMWFSSGGTKSVVHTDSVDNINCLYRGDKTFVMVDPDIYGDKVDMDHPEGAYSSVDVDRVDYNKYPGLADVEYYTINITAGDCLFIPYKWIHQVRSYGSNIAVNIWWNHFKNKDINLDLCNHQCNLDMTLGNVEFGGFEQVMETLDSIKDHMNGLVLSKKEIDYEGFITAIVGLFVSMDTNSDGKMTKDELQNLSESVWTDIWRNMRELSDFLDDFDKMRHGDFRFKDEL
ncbi:hypothetical protein FSP39_007148 [Pinctada imbricata]|uniref:JmjC domain-containing protein n=1 Tax=Pinctada imbricata TaxID=66713 RepID=A0AA88YDC2_PINIB|nr:hypothetical protein FSP39_007148 [Pinctada imbricata]